jgi:hypothetical protein
VEVWVDAQGVFLTNDKLTDAVLCSVAELEDITLDGSPEAPRGNSVRIRADCIRSHAENGKELHPAHVLDGREGWCVCELEAGDEM